MPALRARGPACGVRVRVAVGATGRAVLVVRRARSCAASISHQYCSTHQSNKPASAACRDGDAVHRRPDGLARGSVRGAPLGAVVHVLGALSGHERRSGRRSIRAPNHPGGWVFEVYAADGVSPSHRDTEHLRYVPTVHYQYNLCVRWASVGRS